MSSLLVLDSTTWLQPAVRQPRSPCLRIPQVMLFLTLSWYRVARLRRRRCRPRCSRWCLTACWVLTVLDAAATCVSTRYAFLLLVALWSKYTVFTPKALKGPSRNEIDRRVQGPLLLGNRRERPAAPARLARLNCYKEVTNCQRLAVHKTSYLGHILGLKKAKFP